MKIDFGNQDKLVSILSNYDIMLSAVPYPLNPMLTKIAIKAQISMVDLGGHTQNVISQLKYHDEAVKKNITIVPDCGMGPGMNISMALLSMEQLDSLKMFIYGMVVYLKTLNRHGIILCFLISKD